MAANTSSFELSGLDSMQRAIDHLAHEFQSRVNAAIQSEADAIMARSKAEFVPVDTGALRDSGRVGDIVHTGTDGDTTSISLSYGDEQTAPYATAIHEHPSRSDPPSWKGVQVTFSPEGRGPKYLERPLRDAASTMDRRLADKLKLGG